MLIRDRFPYGSRAESRGGDLRSSAVEISIAAWAESRGGDPRSSTVEISIAAWAPARTTFSWADSRSEAPWNAWDNI